MPCLLFFACHKKNSKNLSKCEKMGIELKDIIAARSKNPINKNFPEFDNHSLEDSLKNYESFINDSLETFKFMETFPELPYRSIFDYPRRDTCECLFVGDNKSKYDYQYLACLNCEDTLVKVLSSAPMMIHHFVDKKKKLTKEEVRIKEKVGIGNILYYKGNMIGLFGGEAHMWRVKLIQFNGRTFLSGYTNTLGNGTGATVYWYNLIEVTTQPKRLLIYETWWEHFEPYLTDFDKDGDIELLLPAPRCYNVYKDIWEIYYAFYSVEKDTILPIMKNGKQKIIKLSNWHKSDFTSIPKGKHFKEK